MQYLRPGEAKKGAFVDSFDDEESFKDAAERMEEALKRQKTNRGLVYTIVPVMHRIQWHIYLMP